MSSDRISLMRNGNATDYIRYFQSLKLTFAVVSSNYTLAIESDFFKKKFVKTMQSNRVFAAFSKIKSNVKHFMPPAINRSRLVYFQHNLRKDSFNEVVYNIDLKSAYANILKSEGYITEETFKYLSKIGKQSRLAAIGMLASRKSTFYFNNGMATDDSTSISDTADFFFYAVQKTSEIMDTLRRICGQSYLFTWVDGIYFKPDDEVLKDCTEYLESIGFPNSFDALRDFKVKIDTNCTRVTFYKEDKLKYFNLPHQTNDFKKTIVNSILSKQSKSKK